MSSIHASLTSFSFERDRYKCVTPIFALNNTEKTWLMHVIQICDLENGNPTRQQLC